jgi:hypothetical protein
MSLVIHSLLGTSIHKTQGPQHLDYNLDICEDLDTGTDFR